MPHPPSPCVIGTIPSPRLAQELLNYILDHIDDYVTLRSCSLVASCLRPYAQERLFTAIRIDATHENNNLPMLYHSLQSTSLARHTRRVEITGHTYLINLADVPFLTKVVKLLASARHPDAQPQEADSEPSNSIVYLRCEQLGVNERQLMDIVASFPRLSTLEFGSCHVLQGEADDQDSRNATFIPLLTHLSFRECSPPEKLLRALASSKDVKLRSMEFFLARISPPAYQALIESSREYLEHCSIVPGIFGTVWPIHEDNPLSFERHTTLRSLQLGYPQLCEMGIGRWILALAQMLRSIVSNLEVLDLQSILILHTDDPAAAFAVLDQLLSEGPQFARLRRVDICIYARLRTRTIAADQHSRVMVTVTDDVTPQKIVKLGAWLPGLRKRSILYCEGTQVVAQ